MPNRQRSRIRPYPQSAIEEACLWSLVQGYAVWAWRTPRRLRGMLAYARALGLEPTWPLREDES